jgi:hypothetical protein
MPPGGCWSARVGGEPQRPSDVSIGVQAPACEGQGRGEVGSAPDHRLNGDPSVRRASGPTVEVPPEQQRTGVRLLRRPPSQPKGVAAVDDDHLGAAGSSAQTAEPSSGPQAVEPRWPRLLGFVHVKDGHPGNPGATRLALSLTVDQGMHGMEESVTGAAST